MYLADGTTYAVDLTDPAGFTTYVAMAFVLYALRESRFVANRFLPLVAIILGLIYSTFVEYNAFNEASIIAGCRLGILGLGSVAAVKYFLSDKKKEQTPTDT